MVSDRQANWLFWFVMIVGSADLLAALILLAVKGAT